MPTYRIPASFYIEAENVHAAVQIVTQYLDNASYDPELWGDHWDACTAVDVETHQAEECPPVPAED